MVMDQRFIGINCRFNKMRYFYQGRFLLSPLIKIMYLKQEVHMMKHSLFIILFIISSNLFAEEPEPYFEIKADGEWELFGDVLFTHDSSQVIVGGKDIRVYDLKERKLSRTYNINQYPIINMGITKNKDLLVYSERQQGTTSGVGTEYAKLLDLNENKIIHPYGPHQPKSDLWYIMYDLIVDISPDGKHVVTHHLGGNILKLDITANRRYIMTLIIKYSYTESWIWDSQSRELLCKILRSEVGTMATD